MSRATVLKTLLEYEMHPYHAQRVQAVTPDNYLSLLNFANWYLQQTAVNQTVPADVLFTYEDTFTGSGIFKVLNSHLCGHDDVRLTQ